MASSGVKGCKEVPTLALTSENAFEFESFSPPPFFPSMKSFFAQPYKIFSVRNFRGNCDAKKEDKDMTKT